MPSIFQQDKFYSFLAATETLTPFRYSICRDGKEVASLQGYIQRDGKGLKRFLSRRAIVNGGPWFAEDITPEEVCALLKKCKEDLKKKVIYMETRNFSDYAPFRSMFEKEGFHYEPHYDFILDTDSIEKVEAQVHKSRRRDVNISERNGACIVDCPEENEVIAFYSVLEELYKKKVKTPLFPLQFFLSLFKEDFCQFILVKYQQEIIGGTVLVYDKETVFEWFACGKDGVFKQVFPSTMATYYGIHYAAENGFKHFDMMGAGAPGDGGYGVREFKARFGGELVEYGRFKYVCNNILYGLGAFGVKLMKRLK